MRCAFSIVIEKKVKKKIMMFVVGFSGIVDIFLEEESPKWMKFRLSDGELFFTMRFVVN